MPYTNVEKEQILRDIGDQSKVMVFCQRHMYFGEPDTAPTAGCKGCWLVYYTVLIGRTPPHLRAQRIAELTDLVHHINEEVEKGNFDVDLFNQPIVKIDKDAN